MFNILGSVLESLELSRRTPPAAAPSIAFLNKHTDCRDGGHHITHRNYQNILLTNLSFARIAALLASFSSSVGFCCSSVELKVCFALQILDDHCTEDLHHLHHIICLNLPRVCRRDRTLQGCRRLLLIIVFQFLSRPGLQSSLWARHLFVFFN